MQQHASQVAQVMKNTPSNAGHIREAGFIPGGDSLEESIATHSDILTWRIPWTEEPGGPQSTVLQKVGHNRNDLACMQQQVQAWAQ